MDVILRALAALSVVLAGLALTPVAAVGLLGGDDSPAIGAGAAINGPSGNNAAPLGGMGGTDGGPLDLASLSGLDLEPDGPADASDGLALKCTSGNAKQVLLVAARGEVSEAEIKAWSLAREVKIVSVRLCHQTRKLLDAIFERSGKIQRLHRAVAIDTRIVSSLGRARYGADDVFAVRGDGTRLMIYVY